VPMAISVWDDGYGISVPAKYQTTKQSISEVLKGFEKTDDKDGFVILTAKAWDYPGLIDTYERGIEICRTQHIPVLFHIQEVTQPQGHSTSGSHERYKSKERLAWEEEYDCIRKFREWILNGAIATSEELDEAEKAAKKSASDSRKRAWDSHQQAIKEEINQAVAIIEQMAAESPNKVFIEVCASKLKEISEPERKDINVAVKKALRYVREEETVSRDRMIQWLRSFDQKNADRYDSHQFSESKWSVKNIHPVPATYASDAPAMDGREILQAHWDHQLAKRPEVFIFGEDVGNIGGVNQTYETIALTLAYSACLVLITYSLAFRFYDRFVMLKRNGLLVALGFIVLAVIALGGLRMLSPEMRWNVPSALFATRSWSGSWPITNESCTDMLNRSLKACLSCAAMVCV